MCVLLTKEPIFPFLYAQVSNIECLPMELLFNFRNVHSLFGMKRMLLDSLRWILFHTPLNNEQHLHSGLLDAIRWVHACSLGGGGHWGLRECDLESPSVPVRTTLSSPDQSNTVTLAPPGNHEIY